MSEVRYVNGEEIVGPYIVDGFDKPSVCTGFRVARRRTVQEWTCRIATMPISVDLLTPEDFLNAQAYEAYLIATRSPSVPAQPVNVSFFKKCLRKLCFWDRKEGRKSDG